MLNQVKRQKQTAKVTEVTDLGIFQRSPILVANRAAATAGSGASAPQLDQVLAQLLKADMAKLKQAHLQHREELLRRQQALQEHLRTIYRRARKMMSNQMAPSPLPPTWDQRFQFMEELDEFDRMVEEPLPPWYPKPSSPQK
jgi:hypothetical protein